jgi:hypothetical protein
VRLRSSRVSSKREKRAAWFAPAALLLAALLGGGIALAGPLSIFAIVLVVLAALPVLWVVVSALWPARAERTCPACRSERLERADPRTTVGVRCLACGWRDDSASAWLLAEEEGPLEDVVLAQRGRKPRSPRGPGRDGPEPRVDSSRGSG